MSDRDVSNLPSLMRAALREEYNSLVDALGYNGVLLHYEEAASTDLEDTADATDATTAIALANALKATQNAHMASTAKHSAADATNPTTEPDATDQTTLNTLANALKTDLNAHQAFATPHRGKGGQGSVIAAPQAVATANATDAATSIALVNALKAAFNHHVSSGAQNIADKGN